MNIKVSVIVPVYNSSKYISVLLSSVVAQTLKEIEIIVVDDKSTDNSLEIVKHHANWDSRIRVIEQKANCGVSVTRNTGLCYAKGQYIAFADSDDFMAPNALEDWFNFSEHKHLDLMIGNAFRFTNAPYESLLSPLLNKQSWQDVKSGRQWIEDAVDTKEWPHYPWLQLIKREVLENSKIEFIEGLVHEDILWTMQIALTASRVSFFNEPLYGYRKTPNSILTSNDNESIMFRCQSYLTVIDTMGKQASEYPQQSKLRKALLRQCNRESGYLLGIVRKKIIMNNHKRNIAKEFFKRDLHKIILTGVTNMNELWRAVKCIYTLRKYSNFGSI